MLSTNLGNIKPTMGSNENRQPLDTQGIGGFLF